jgi:hypothetical protein
MTFGIALRQIRKIGSIGVSTAQYEFCIPNPATEVPSGSEWFHESK